MTDPDSGRTRRPVLLLSPDLMIQERVTSVLGAAGFDLLVVGSPDQLDAAGEPQQREVQLTEPLEGSDARFLSAVAESQPALIVFDLNTRALPWERWIHVLKTSSASRRIPVIAFGPHVDQRTLDLARQRGADLVLPRGRFLNDTVSIVKEHAVQVAAKDLNAACQGQLSELARKGVELHDAGEYFEAHEELEHAWMEAPELEGYLYRSLLQITVACLHIERGNLRGARKMLLRVRQWLDALPPHCRGIDTQALRDYAQELREAVESGAEEIEPSLLRPFPRAL